MNTETINISILEDHQSIIDGYLYRIANNKRLQITGIAHFGEDLMPVLQANPSDVLILDIEVPISAANPNQFPIFTVFPLIRIKYPSLAVLVISVHTQQVLIERFFEMGVKGYIFKQDQDSIEHLDEIIVKLKNGGSHFSQGANEQLSALKADGTKPLLSPRQLEALSLCVAFPDSTSTELARRLGVSSSTFRNLLSNAYDRLGVRTRVSALAELQKMGIGSSKKDFQI